MVSIVMDLIELTCRYISKKKDDSKFEITFHSHVISILCIFDLNHCFKIIYDNKSNLERI